MFSKLLGRTVQHLTCCFKYAYINAASAVKYVVGIFKKTVGTIQFSFHFTLYHAYSKVSRGDVGT